MPDTAALRRLGLSLRAEEASDLPFLYALDAAIRGTALAGIAWSDAEKARFLDHQFRLQHHHFHLHHAGADFLIIRHRFGPIGRLYLDRTRPLWRIVDIAIAPPLQHDGLGSALVRWAQRAARRADADGVDLHVARDNPRAARLYAALGFVDAIAALPHHRRMTWRAPS